ncbi:hypothetical protein MJO28_000311 [Puccinia striiformis f. sp. tritici]|uniref:Uncharacterized protein n=1 Tax=Puccinia striiformis f. sp. tritici TaxID=168172 RepID=A0ACC0EXX1_9BASI|nr:hypothetical protein MJO28_000311 [Puccinia striiformis f. sp. tritici]
MLGLLSDTVLTMHVVASTPEEALASDAISASDGVTHWRPHDAYMPDERWHAENCVTPKVLWHRAGIFIPEPVRPGLHWEGRGYLWCSNCQRQGPAQLAMDFCKEACCHRSPTDHAPKCTHRS